MNTALLSGLIRGNVGRLFDLMEIAEEELERAGVRRKGDLAELYPGPFLRTSADLYRAHARELAERMKHGQSCEPGTLAEALLVMIETSLAAPLTRAGQATYETLFARLLPDEAKRLGIVPSPGIHPGQVEEDIAALRKRLAGKRPKC